MEGNYDEYINPIEKLEDLCKLVEDYKHEVHYRDTDEYSYLGEKEACITIPNTSSDSKIYIDLDDEFTLTFGSYHSHFSSDIEDYKQLIEMLLGILHNEVCAVHLYSSISKKWYGSTSISGAELIRRDYREIFAYVLKIKEFRKALGQEGAEVHYCYWDSSLDTIESITKQDFTNTLKLPHKQGRRR